MLYFTSDLHLGHENAIRHGKRPFDSVEQMNRTLIRNINERVGPRDTLYILGDFSYRIPVVEAAKLAEKIYCKDVHLVRGNHDKNFEGLVGSSGRPLFASVQDYLEIKHEACQKIIMMHYPILAWHGMEHGTLHLHGHIHSKGSVDGECGAAGDEFVAEAMAFGGNGASGFVAEASASVGNGTSEPVAEAMTSGSNGLEPVSHHLVGYDTLPGLTYNESNAARGILRYDVGVDANEYAPVGIDEILGFKA